MTQAVGRHEQGAALGVSGSLQSIAMALAPPVGGALISNGWLTAWAMVPGGVALLGLLATGVVKKPPVVTPAPARGAGSAKA